MALSLETMFCHPGAFGMTTASNMQRAICRVCDGKPLGDLADDPVVQKCFGGYEAIASLPAQPPLEFVLLAAIRCGKSLFTAALALYTALTIDLSGLPAMGADEMPNVVVVSLDKYRAKVVMKFMMAVLNKKGGLLNDLLVRRPKPTSESFIVRRLDGRLVEIIVAAGKRGGDNLVSRWTLVAIFDEAARMLGQADGVVNYEDQRSAVIERLRLLRQHGAMARLVAVSSPWAARGPIYETVTEWFGKPSGELVVVRATGPDLCPPLWTPEAVEAARLARDGAYETDVLGLFADPENGWLSATEVEKAKRPLGEEKVDEDGYPVGLPRELAVSYVAAMDPAVAGNAWSLIVVGRRPSETGDESDDSFFVALARQWQGTPQAPLKARRVFAEMALLLREYRCTEVHSDRWSSHALGEIAELVGITVTVSSDSSEQKNKAHTDFRTLLVDGRLELAPHRLLCADLLSKKKRLLPGGRVDYPAPVTRDGRHADFADAAVLAVARAGGDVGWAEAFDRHRRRGSGPGPFG